MLWNPAIQEFKLLPESNISSAQGGADIGFGYELSAKDYNVVRICYPRYGNLDDDARAEVYMLRTDSWSEISWNPDISYLSESWPLCWRGVCYWLMLSSDLTSDESKILCFDICKEEFHTLPNPFENNLCTACPGFSVWNDFPAFYVLFSFGTYSQSRIEIYVLDNYFDVEVVKGACSWTKSVYTMIPGFDFVYSSWKNDELLVVDSNVQLASCNLRTKTLRGIAIHGLGQAGLLHCSYVKSLVSVRGR